MNAPLTHFYNLGRLGKAGETVEFTADAGQCAAVAAWSGVLSLDAFAVTVDISKLGPTRFRLAYQLTAQVTQACVVTLEPVAAVVARDFSRELHFVGRTRGPAADTESGADVVLDAGGEDEPEEIESLHYDLAAPALEEYSLALDPYPRSPGAEFSLGTEPPQETDSPFAVLKGLKGQA
ncbi:MAG TPA: hypothetical protein VFS01_15140 [Rhizomicrobium sp.]|jgi:uncharacterized metal-binding protein YceD (DUF177 family)|nr:hypothetical protein [Rhizomicrobium sp.]